MDEETEQSPNPTETTELTSPETKTKSSDGGATTKQEEEKGDPKSNLDTNVSDIASQSSVKSGDTDYDNISHESLWHKIRRFVRQEIVQTSWFETVILIVILINCVFLALDNPTNEDETLQDVILITEYCFTVIYIIEMLLKWIGLGFFGRHTAQDTAKDKNADQKASVFSYMVNTVFNGEEEAEKKDEYVGYFLDGWNVLDFVVVVLGSIVPLALPNAASVSSIRALRTLRALRTIPRVPKLRTLVMTIIDAIPGLTGSFILLSFFFIVFGIIGIQLFHGQLKEQCTTMVEGVQVPLKYISVDTEYTALCQVDEDNPGGKVFFGKNVAPQTCNDVAIALGLPPIYECTDHNPNPVAGMQNYDDIFYSLLQIFQTVTLQDWSMQLYNLSRSRSYVVTGFFVPLTFLVSFFAINLILAVIVDTYSRSGVVVQMEEDYDSTLHEMDDLIAQKTSKRSAPVKQQITYKTYPRKLRALREKVKTFEELFKEYNQGPVERANKTHELQRKTKLRVDTARGDDVGNEAKSVHLENLRAIAEEVQNESKEEIYDAEEMKEETWEFTQRADEQKKLRREMIEDMMLNFNKDLAFEVWLLAKPIKDDWLSGKPEDHGQIVKATPQSTGVGGSVETEQRDKRRCWEKRKPMFIRWLHWVSTSEWFEKAIIFIILLNTIILAIHWPAMNEELEQGLQVLNWCFTILFALELLIKVIGLGPERWWFDKFNVFDAVIVLVSLVELGIPDAGAGALLAFRALRVLRVLRLLHQIPGLRQLFTSILNSFEPVVFLTLIILLFVFMFGVLGVQLFAGLVYPDLRMDNETGELDGFLLMTRPWRFDGLWYSMVTFLQLFTGDGWPSVMEDTVLATDEGSALIVIVAVIIGLWLFRNMFLAILINRLGSQDNIQLMIDDLLILAREKQRIFDEKTAIKEFEKDVRQIRKQRMGSQSASKHQNRIEKIEARKKITGKSLGCILPDNTVRVMLHKLQASDAFEWTINILILVNCVFLALHSPHVPHESELGQTLHALNWVFTAIFFFEMIVKMVALGIYKSSAPKDTEEDEEKEKKERARKRKKHNHEFVEDDIDYAAMPCTNAYTTSGWNIIDGLVVLFAILGLIWPQVAFVRGLRAIRPIRIAIRIPNVRVVVKALLASLNPVFIALTFSFFVIFVLGIVGLQLFSGQFNRCVWEGNSFDVVMGLEEPTEAECLKQGHVFVLPGYNFDNIFISLLTVFKISMFSNWYDELSAGMASGGTSKQDPSAFAAIPYNRPFAASFFVLIVLVAGFFVLNIIISVVVDSFNRIKNEDEANALLTEQQVLWVRKRRFLHRFPLRQGHKPPKAGWRLPFFNLVEKSLFEYFIIFCILLNTVILMTEHDTQPEEWFTALTYLEIVFVAIFIVEAVLKLLGYGIKGYFGEWWNVFDFVIIVASLIGLAVDDSGLAVIRLLRVLRVIRLVKKAPLLRALFVTLGYALPSLVNIGLLLLVIFFIFGIFGVELFGKIIHSDGYGNRILYDSNEGLSRSVNFEYFGNSLLILYRTATNDNWGSILLAAGAEGEYCPDSLLEGQEAPDGTFDYACGSMPWAVVYFVLFTIFGTFVLVNLFIAVILDTYVDNVEFETKLVKLQLLNDWKQRWIAKEKEIYGKKLKPRLPIKMFVNTLKASPILIGFLLEALNLRLNIEDTDAEIDYEDIAELKRRSTETYGKLDFVGKPNSADKQVEVTNDHLNAVFKTRRLRILCSYRGSDFNETLVVTYSDALFALCSLLVGPEFRLLPYDNNRQVHISDWWAERLEDMMMSM